MKRKKKMTSKSKKPKQSLRNSKSAGFLESLKENSMVDYFTSLRILNPAAELMNGTDGKRREGGFVRLAHARDEFEAPKLNKGKAVYLQEQERRATKKKSSRKRRAR